MNKISKTIVGVSIAGIATLGVLTATSASAAQSGASAPANVVVLPGTVRVVPIPGRLLAAGATAIVQVTGTAPGQADPGATGVVVKLTSVTPTGTGSLVVYAGDTGAPGNPTVQFTKGAENTGSATVRLPADGQVKVTARGASTRFLLSVDAEFAPAAAAPVVPQAVTASTSVSDWPESSGWATDAFVRTLTVQPGVPVDAGKCGASAAQCFFYQGTQMDNGSFVTVDGHASPADPAVTIHGTNSGTMVGGTKVEFYASAAPDATLVPATMAGHGSVGTSDWARQLFPAGTAFGSFSLPAYDWTYTAAATCEAWNDAITPGDDGQDAATDGNITGVSGC